jgi:hypothetical protein
MEENKKNMQVSRSLCKWAFMTKETAEGES